MAALEATPVKTAEFARLMSPLGPFEARPRLAVAVSGGPDSLALTLLLHRWVKARGGRVTALTVDHGLRRESAAEARAVGALLNRLGIPRRILVWHGDKPQRGLQEAARAARYRLLAEWCGEAGIVDLALGHQREDQSETLLLRLAGGSGPDGLAAMPALTRRGNIRLLRPLLTVPRTRLLATLAARRIRWIEDPSNRDPRFARVRLRQALPGLRASGGTAADLAESVRRFGRSRAAGEADLARLLAEAVELRPGGFALVEREALLAAPSEIAERALGRLCMTVGGREHPPRSERVRLLLDRLRTAPRAATTLGGCRFLPWHGRLLVTREARALPSLTLLAEQRLVWDGRFEAGLERRPADARGTVSLGALGSADLAALKRAVDGSLWDSIPAAARAVLPALRDRRGLLAVPALSFFRSRAVETALSCRFWPPQGLSPDSFTVA
ncbi:MAG: tRNA lysidine(34) synthetase TilS [Kiloniellales bacterium]